MTSEQLSSGFQQLQKLMRIIRLFLGNDLLAYSVKRLFQGLLTLFLASILTFYIVDLAPGDYLDAFKNNPQMSQQRLTELREEFGLDKTWQDSRLVTSLKTSDTPVTALAISADGETLVVGNLDKAVRIWNKEGSLAKTLEGHQGPITAMALSPDGQLIVSGSQDQTLRIWNKEGKLLQTLKGHQGPITAMAFSADGKTLASGSKDQEVRLWQTDGKLLKTLPGKGTVTALQFAKSDATGIYLYTVTNDQTLTEWNLEGKQIRQRPLAELQGQTLPITKVLFSPDREIFATLSKITKPSYGNWRMEQP
ncbi:MAG: hypothetical protein HC934_13125 [Acaryochloridaceae cyanobacterium SU_2_1]|nr:hypothetical protein [Acaryochloridaceae cyanobacterium SU_2_1]